MATLLLTAAVSALNLGTWGMFAANLAATAIGTFIDSRLFGVKTNSTGPRLEEISLSNSTEGASIKRLYGRSRLGGTLIWATNFKEEVSTTKTQIGKGGGGGNTTTEYSYSISFAVAFCEGSAELEYGRIWADNTVIDPSKYVMRFYRGTEAQSPDSYIQQIEGIENTPAYRGIAYIVFENLPLEEFGRRIPQITVEITKPIVDPGADNLESLISGVTLLPGAGAFAYSTSPTVGYTHVNPPVMYESPENYKPTSETLMVNTYVDSETADISFSLDKLQSILPEVETVNIVTSWFGSDLRCGNCQIKPKVRTRDLVTDPEVWVVNGIPRANADVLSTISGMTTFDGTPSDHSIVECIADLKARGLKVCLSPMILMDIVSGNTLPNPYSDNSATIGQPALPWRGRVTCSPAEEYLGTVNKTSAAATQVTSFFGAATIGNFTVTGTKVSWSGGTDWGLRRMVLHYAHLCVAAGGVDYFLIGSEMPGLTKIRSSSSVFPGVDQLNSLANDVKTIVGSTCEIGYAADWSEYHSYKAKDGTNDLYFNMDPLFLNTNISFIGIQNYLPMSDWRDGVSHLDYDEATGPRKIYDRDYLASQIEGGELFDYIYASDADRDDQARTPIVDNSYGRPWEFRQKDIRSWWLNDHYNRPGGILPVENLLETSNNIGSASWTRSGGPTVTSGVAGDPIGGNNGQTITDSSTVNLGSIYNTSGTNAVVRAGEQFSFSCYFKIDATATHIAIWRIYGTTTGNSHRLDIRLRPSTGDFYISVVGTEILVTAQGSMDAGGGWRRFYCDFRCSMSQDRLRLQMFPAFGADGTNWQTVGSSNATIGSTIIFGPMLCAARRGFTTYQANASSLPIDIRSSRTTWEPGRKKIIFTAFGCPAVDKGTNQPSALPDERSSENRYPYYSVGNRDDVIQRVYLEVFCQYWRDNAPTSPTSSLRMVVQSDMWAWGWDARPFPYFPNLSSAWTDTAKYETGYWLSGRAGAVTLPSLITEFMSFVGLEEDIDVSEISGSNTLVNGYVIDSIMSPRDMLMPLFSAFQFDGYESGGKIRYGMRGDTIFTDLAVDDFVTTEQSPGGFSIVRKQDSELATMARVSFIDEQNAYQVGSVNGQRLGPETENVVEVKYPIVLAQGYAKNVADILVQESWATRETGTIQLPPSFARLDPTDGIRFTIGEREFLARVSNLEIGENLEVNFETHDHRMYTPMLFAGRPTPLSVIMVTGKSTVEFLDIPLITGEEERPWAPRVVAYQSPFPTAVNIFIKDEDTSDLKLINQLFSQTQMGVLTADLAPGQPWLVDTTNTLELRVVNPAFQPISVTRYQMFSGLNAIAVRNDSGNWEILQYQDVEILSSDTYRLSNLLRGQLGTEVTLDHCSSGNSVVFLDVQTLEALKLSQDERAMALQYHYGPSNRETSHWSYTTETLQFNSVALRPYAPTGLRCLPITLGGDVVFTWKRRTRFGGDEFGTAEVPINESTEKYEIEICTLDGDVLRTIRDIPEPTYTYTLSQQIVDYGRPQSSFRLRLYQINDIVGRGGMLDKIVSY